MIQYRHTRGKEDSCQELASGAVTLAQGSIPLQIISGSLSGAKHPFLGAVSVDAQCLNFFLDMLRPLNPLLDFYFVPKPSLAGKSIMQAGPEKLVAHWILFPKIEELCRSSILARLS